MTAQSQHVVIALVSMAFSAVASPGLHAAPSKAEPHFEVASVKINQKAEGPSQISGPTPGRFVATNTPLRFIILYAYGLLDHQLAAAPEWTWSTSIDITATYPAGSAPDDREVRAMVRNLLNERFGFKAHSETREMPAYALTLARKDGRLGPRMNRSEVDCAKWTAEKRPTANAGGRSSVSPTGKRPACGMLASRRFLTGGTRTAQQLAVTLQSMLGRPVVDQTGLAGAWDVDLQWTSDNNSETSQGDAPSIFTAVQEQLGLKLVPAKTSVDVLVVDNVERPAQN
ncbi:MAG TPA: TIGR03435 family protein [Bryobacteraceae bacterium]|jgi:uncharacterized protein (TIGR03435 family)|nr:TIGR03435 family protein [Bryobacteraceae bacterium]